MESQEEKEKHPRERKGWQKIAIATPLFYNGRHTEITQEDLEAIRKNIIASNRDILVDWEHESELKTGRVPAAGWIKNPFVEIHGNELWAKVDWTRDGQRDVEEGNVRYISPYIKKRFQNKKTGEPAGAYLKSAAITNIPYIDELKIAATENSAPEGGDHEETIVLSMEIHKQLNQKEKRMKEIAKRFGLGEEATEAQVIEAADKFIAKANETEKRLNEIAATAGTPPDKIVASMKELKAKAEKKAEGEKSKDAEVLALNEKITDLKKNDEKREKEINDLQKINRQNEIELLLHEGKIDPSRRDFYLKLRERDPELYEEEVKTLKPKNRDKMPVNVQTVNGEETIIASEGVNPESAKLRAKVLAYAEKHKITYQEALRKVKAQNG